MKRSTPAARPVSNDGSDRLPSAGPVSSDGSDPLQALNGCPAGEGLNHSDRRTGPRTESYVKSVGSIRAACEGPTSTPLQQQYPHGRPGESESSSGRTRATGITHPGFYGRKPWKKPNSAIIINVPRPAEEGLRSPFARLPPNRSQNLTTNPSHSRPGYRHRSPKLSLFRSSRFLIALRVSKSAV